MIAISVLAVACSGDSSSTVVDSADSAGGATVTDDQDFGEVFSGPMVELPASVAPAPGQTNALSGLPSDADPTTALGALRARHLPVWSPELEGAFPPYVCESAWELDAIAEPDPDADVRLLGDYLTAAALAVMRYEFQFSRALHQPSVLAQLCVAVASVGRVRADSLEVLRQYLATRNQHSEPPAFPEEVVIVAVSPVNVLAVACIRSGYATVMEPWGEAAESAEASVRLQAYLLTVSRGIEDAVTDVSYRVSNGSHQAAQDCDRLDTWSEQWYTHVLDWISQGRLWQIVGTSITATQICQSPPPEGPNDCPIDWLS